MVAGETTTSRQLPHTCALTTPGRSAGVDGGHQKLTHVAAVQSCGSSEHACRSLRSAVRRYACSALCSCDWLTAPCRACVRGTLYVVTSF